MAKVLDFSVVCSTSEVQLQTEKVNPLLSRNSTVVDILIAAEQTRRNPVLKQGRQ